MRWPLVFVLAAAGCLAPAAQLDPTASSLAVEGVGQGEVVVWNGTLTAGPLTLSMQLNDLRCWAHLPCEPSTAVCGEGNCERRHFTVGEGAGGVVLSVRWPTVPDAKFDAWIESADGEVLALAPREYVSYVGLVARLEDPAPGEYVAVIAARAGSFPHEAALRVESRGAADGAVRALLPDLVTLAPTDLHLDTPQYSGASYFAFPIPGLREATEAIGVKGCRLDERAEYGHARCLRFSNSVANLGEGPLDVRLDAGETSFVQRVHASDGSVEAHPGGAAQWHATHAHWHNAASTIYSVHPFDPETGAVGESLGAGKKGGICFADTATAGVGLPVMRPATFTGWGCMDPASPSGVQWWMGITPGWYDLYPYTLPEQYVPIDDVADGTYALCATVNAEGTLLESDLTNNRACTGFMLAGDTIELLDPEPYHTIPRSHRI